MLKQPLWDRALAAYLGFACGDALGATVEFLKPAQIQTRYGVHQDIIGGGWLGLAAGQVTDDTQMALALGQAIIDRQGWHIATVADYFLNWMNSNPPDIGNTTRRGICRYRDSGELFGVLRADDAGNGACMRNLPVVLFTLQQPQNFIDYTIQQSHITHHHPAADAATLCLGYMLQALLQGASPAVCLAHVDQLLAQYPEFAYQPYPGRASAYIVHTVQTVLHYFFSTDSFESCVIATVNQGEDADTTGALAGMLAGAKYGLSAIPQRWLQQLDQQVVTQIQAQTLALLQLAQLSQAGAYNS